MIDRPLAEFLQEGLDIHVGTRNKRLEPNGARAVAVKVEEDGTHFVVFMAKVAARRVLADMEANRQAAVVFGRPTDERSCQVKGELVSVRAARAGDRELMQAQSAGLLRYLEEIGIPAAASRNTVGWPAVAIRLRATALFEQTPGPDAGKPLS